MSANYSITVDPARGLVRVKLNGFFDAAEVTDFAIAKRDAYARLGSRLGEHLTLVDVTDCKIQTQDVVEAFRALLADPAMQSRRIAFVTGWIARTDADPAADPARYGARVRRSGLRRTMAAGTTGDGHAGDRLLTGVTAARRSSARVRASPADRVARGA